MDAIGAFYQEGHACRLTHLQVGNQSPHIGISDVRRRDGAKLVAYKKDLFEAARLQIIHNLAMFVQTVFPKLAHIPQDNGLMRRFHLLEVGKSGHHAGRIGIVSIDDKGIIRRTLQLRTVVLRSVFGLSLVYQVGIHLEIIAYGYGSQRIRQVVAANEAR